MSAEAVNEKPVIKSQQIAVACEVDAENEVAYILNKGPFDIGPGTRVSLPFEAADALYHAILQVRLTKLQQRNSRQIGVVSPDAVPNLKPQ